MNIHGRMNSFSLKQYKLNNSPINNYRIGDYRINGKYYGIDPYTILMMHMDGPNGSTIFTDSSMTPKTVSANGSAQISTAQSTFGGASGSFNGTSSYLSIPDNADWFLSNQDFTFDFWIMVNSLPLSGNGYFLFCQYQDGSNFYDCMLYNNVGTYQIQMRVSGIGAIISANVSISTSIWYHIAIVRNGDTMRIFLNGIQQATSTYSGTISDFNGSFVIGAENSGSYFNGYMDEFRFSKGIARWVSNFTPPTSEYTT